VDQFYLLFVIANLHCRSIIFVTKGLMGVSEFLRTISEIMEIFQVLLGETQKLSYTILNCMQIDKDS
jgi:hypothetical protein